MKGARVMCLGIPARLVSLDADRAGLATVAMAGVRRTVDVGLLDEPPTIGDWLLVHMGFALQSLTAEQAAEALRAFTNGPDPATQCATADLR
jgi:hydrogenase expression/formation protein HypC